MITNVVLRVDFALGLVALIAVAFLDFPDQFVAPPVQRSDSHSKAGTVFAVAFTVQERLVSDARVTNSSWRVGRKMISFTSISSGWLMAKATARAKESKGSRHKRVNRHRYLLCDG